MARDALASEVLISTIKINKNTSSAGPLHLQPTQELHLPLPHALHLHGGEVRQVVVLVPQGVLLQAERGQAPGRVPARENSVRTIWGQETQLNWSGRCSQGFRGDDLVLYLKSPDL